MGDVIATLDASDPELARQVTRDYWKPEAEAARRREAREEEERRNAAFNQKLIFDSACRFGVAWGIGMFLIVIDLAQRKAVR